VDAFVGFDVVVVLAEGDEVANQWIGVNPCGGKSISDTATALGCKHAGGKRDLRR